ncbi:hypothetical protein EXN68_01035 [Rhizobium rhizogenes]|uniref:Uncharacterized protein n=1 Tax=Rhizobium rhizogenes TaxID=359 RepID=A0A546XNJ6_RHIRH|nr:hypothetical protein EXN68_01035 [Rhizobium rhizogenes]
MRASWMPGHLRAWSGDRHDGKDVTSNTRRRIYSAKLPTPSFLCLSQESSRRASARRKRLLQPKDLVWLDLCDKHRDEGGDAHR